jgi:ERCC4-type nuclease
VSNNSPINVDDRAGSKELVPALEYLHLPCKVKRLKFGDFCFLSPHGPDGYCTVGIERKTVSEVVGSIQAGASDRMSGTQIPGMLENYDFSILIVEGLANPNPATSQLEIPNRKGRWIQTGLHYRALDASLTTLEMQTPVKVLRTMNPQDTALRIEVLWRWFDSKKWDQHKSHFKFPQVQQKYVELTQASLFRRIAKEIPGIGWERSKLLERYFGNVLEMVNADVSKWGLIDGITTKRAQAIWKMLRGIK